MSAYEDLLRHHLLSVRNLIASTPDSSYPDSAGEESAPMNDRVNPEWDYSEIHDLGAFLSFQAAADYCLTCFDDSSEGDYDPTRECFVVVLGGPMTMTMTTTRQTPRQEQLRCLVHHPR